MPKADPVILDHAAEIFLAQGMLDMAARYWRDALSLVPDNKGIQAKLKRLELSIEQRAEQAEPATIE